MQPAIKKSDDYSEVANHIVNNIDQYRVDAQEKTERTIKRLLEEKARAIEMAGKGIVDNRTMAERMGYGDNRTRTGD